MKKIKKKYRATIAKDLLIIHRAVFVSYCTALSIGTYTHTLSIENAESNTNMYKSNIRQWGQGCP